MSPDPLTAVLWFLVFPGLLFTAVVGLLVSWVDRKVTARVQFRVGPPMLQPFYDIMKLLGKETILPAGGSHLAFVGAPLLGLAGATLAATIVGVGAFWPTQGFAGDIIVMLYLLVLPPLAVILGGAASRNPLASLGASREMKLMLGYELPFILALLVPIIASGGKLQISELLAYQAENGAFLYSLSGVLAILVLVLCVQAKLQAVPFDVGEAETEIMGGALIEYSGPLLAVYRLTRAMMLFAVPMFVVLVLWGGLGQTVASGVWGFGKYLILVVLYVLIRNTNPRVRVEHAVRFFWGPVSILAVAAVAAAWLGV